MIRANLRNGCASLAAATAMLIVGSAQAGFTTVKTPPGAEFSQMQILAAQYGVSFHQVGDDFYSANGQLVARRVDDFLSVPGTMSVASGLIGEATDQAWSGNLSVKAVAKFSANSQNLGVICGDGAVHDLFDVTGYGMNISPAAAVCNVGNENYTWLRKGNSGEQTSLDGDNSDGRDHMITYEIDGLAGATGPVWMMFWEDLNRNEGLSMKRSWADYNDLVVEVRGVNAIPLPPGGWAGLVTLGGAMLPRLRRSFQR